MTLDLPAHGVAALLLNDLGPEPAYLNGTCAFYYQCSVRMSGPTCARPFGLLTAPQWPNGTYISN